MMLARVIFTVVSAWFTFGAYAEELTVAYNRGEDTPGTKALMLFQDEVKICTDGETTVILHLGGSLGKLADIVEMVANGVVDIAIVPPFALQKFAKSVEILSIPFVFNNRRHWEAALKDNLYAALKEQIEPTSNTRVLGYL